MLESGRKKLAFLIAGTVSPNVQDRIRGYRKALVEYGMRLEDHIVIQRDSISGIGKNIDVIPGAMELAKEVFRSEREFDGLIASSDVVALSAMRYLHLEGKKIPEDVAVIGFDDERFAQALSVSLTTVHQPRDMGKVALELLLKQIDGKSERGDFEKIVLKPRLIVRESTSL